ncbi:MAG: 50S ribosomal protein L6, partial [Finegoldia magna]|nr:50S ribosomal protein L6 [Finegoldia magna]
EGVTEGYKKTLIIEGTGYRAAKQGKKLVLNLGYSHTIEKEDPEGITVEVPEQHTIIVSGNDKQQVGNYSAKIRDHEHIRRKVGKTGK